MAGNLLEISVRTPEREILVDISERVQTIVSQAEPGFSGWSMSSCPTRRRG